MRFIREEERHDTTGVPTSTWYLLMSRGEAPKPVNIGPRAVAWIDADIQEWMEARIQARERDRAQT